MSVALCVNVCTNVLWCVILCVTVCVTVSITACNNLPTGQPRYLSSLFLAGSSLSEDVSQFDFSTGAHVIPTLHPHQQTQNRTSQVSRTIVHR